MANTITFNRATGTLSWGSKTWTAVSGPHNNGALPAGEYRLERRRVTPHSATIGEPFKDKASGLGFFIPLTAEFATTRTGLGIHPDGNVPGTEGCIGITADAGSFYKAVAKTAPSAVITVDVK
ncbi:MAG: hypothetical protein K0V04_44505 [Deltaproteobacteria bacterium]|nr:hypothetical protein [Deltaproteobacteria bacterium]